MAFHSESINEIAAALAKAQGVLEGATKGKVNPAFKSKYADLASVWDAAREPLSANGLSVVQVTEEEGGSLYLVTMLMHSSGQWISSRYPVRPVKTDPQGYGSALSYARRYMLMSVVGISPEEDDGNAASGNRDDRQHAPANQIERPQPPAQPSPADRKAKETAAAAFKSAIEMSEDLDELGAWWTKHWPQINTLPQDLKAEIVKAKDACKDHLANSAMQAAE